MPGELPPAVAEKAKERKHSDLFANKAFWVARVLRPPSFGAALRGMAPVLWGLVQVRNIPERGGEDLIQQKGPVDIHALQGCGI